MNDRQRQLIEDLRVNGPQFSWDWDADYRFALIVKDTVRADRIKYAIDSSSVLHHRYAAIHGTGIPARRIAALRRLVNRGFVKSYWVGTGAGGLTELGTGRIRAYELVERNER